MTPLRRQNEGQRESPAYRAGILVVLLLGVLPVLLPVFWLLSASLKSKERVSAYPPDWLPVDRTDLVRIAEEPSAAQDASASQAGRAADARTMRVIVIDDGAANSTGVSRVKPVIGADGLTLPPAAIEMAAEAHWYARVDGARREVSVLASAEDEVEVEVLGAHAALTVPEEQVEVVEEQRLFLTLLDRELRVDPVEDIGQTHARSPPGANSGTAESADRAMAVRWSPDVDPIEIAAGLLDRSNDSPGVRIETGVASATISVEITAQNPAAGIVSVRPICPPAGLLVSRARLRSETSLRRFATIDSQRIEVRILDRDPQAHTARIERLDLPLRMRVARAGLSQAAVARYFATVLGQRREVIPLLAAERSEAALPELKRTDPTRPIPVRLEGTLAVAADRVVRSTRLHPRFENYAAAWNEQTFGRYVVNTLFVAALAVFGTVLSCGLVGYAFARLEFRGRDALFLLLLATMMIPAQVTSIPTFVIFVKLGWIDSYKPLIVPNLLAGSAFFVFLYRQHMLTIPADLEDSARLDGCGPLATWWLIMMPLSKPIIVTVAVFTFIGAWNDFLGPLLYLNSDEKQTVALGLQNFKSAFQGAEPQLLLAGSVMMMLPTLAIFFLAQRAFLRGVVITGVKG